MKQFLSAIRLILSSVGIDILEPKKVKRDMEILKEEIIYEFSVNNAEAKMKIEENQYIVLKGSTAVIENRLSAQPAIIRMRDSLVENGVLREDKEKKLYEFTSDYIFNSPSYAAASIAGGNENGRRQWKYKGKNLNEMEMEELE